MSKYEVVVDEIGTVYSGDERSDAEFQFDEYKDYVSEPNRRNSTGVVLFCDGEIVDEYHRPDTESEEE